MTKTLPATESSDVVNSSKAHSYRRGTVYVTSKAADDVAGTDCACVHRILLEQWTFTCHPLFRSRLIALLPKRIFTVHTLYIRAPGSYLGTRPPTVSRPQLGNRPVVAALAYVHMLE